MDGVLSAEANNMPRYAPSTPLVRHAHVSFYCEAMLLCDSSPMGLVSFRRWSEAGIWEAVATTLAQAMADNSRHSLDSTTLLKRSLVSSESGRGER